MALRDQKCHVHFVGIGGIGMSGLAELLLGLGHDVSGSDAKESASVNRLRSLGAEIQIGHGKDYLERCNADVLVYTSAISQDNPELSYARTKHIPIIRRAEMLAEIMHLKRGIAVAGSHGKTTTTAMLGLIMKEAQLDPTLVIGGKFDAIGSNAAWGAGDWIVAEADESDGSFLKLSPEYCIITNLDHEHLDHYGSFAAIEESFLGFLEKIPFYGKAVLCSDSDSLRRLAPRFNKSRVWYGSRKENEPDYLMKVASGGPFPEIELFSRESEFKELALSFQLSVPGRHNQLNASGAAVLALELGVEKSIIARALKSFNGVERRFELKADVSGIKIYEDYAHHPTEIEATLAAARELYPESRIAVLFQPHRYSRTRDSWREFSDCFQNCDYLWTLPIYAASEQQEAWTCDFDQEHFYAHVSHSLGGFVKEAQHAADQVGELRRNGGLKQGDVIFVLGAGDVNQSIESFVKCLGDEGL